MEAGEGTYYCGMKLRTGQKTGSYKGQWDATEERSTEMSTTQSAHKWKSPKCCRCGLHWNDLH